MLLASFSGARRLVVLWFGLVAAAVALFAQTPAAIDGFDPDVDGAVFVLATQPDGKLLIGGQFANVRGTPRANLARLNVDGTLDASFNPGPNGAVRTLALQPDGRIVIGGDFTGMQPGGAGTPIARGCLARINGDGSVDGTFLFNVGGNPLKPQVFALAVQADGAIVVGGSFATVQPGTLATPFNRKNLFRITPAGSLDLAFDPTPDAMVLALAVHVDNKIVLGGAFRTLWPAGDAVPSTRNRIARLNPNGTVDSEFNPNADNGVTTLAIQRDGKIVLGGFFTQLQPIGDASPDNRPHLARLNPNGTIDSEFYPRAEGNVSTVALQPDGSLLIGGSFSAVWGRGANSATRPFVARFNPDGSLDSRFGPVLNGEVDAFAFSPDGKIVLGGLFTRAQPPGATTPLIRNHVARVNADGSFDASFELDPGGRILASITQSDGKTVIGGTFTSVGGATHNYLARLNADGTVDPTYNPDFNGRVYTMAYDASANKVLVGGVFTSIGGEPRSLIARLNANGTIDSEFNPNLTGSQVGVILLQPDGKILVGGTFTSLNPVGGSGSVNRSNLLRLNSNGTLDTAFDPSPNSSIAALALQSDGKILIGGLFSALTPGFATNTSATTTTRAYLGRLNTDGTLDATFKPTINSQVNAIAVQSDGKIVIGGSFTTVVGSDGTLDSITNENGTKTPVAFTRNHIARLTTEGNLDTAYNPNANNLVLAIALQSDGKAIIGGPFTTLQPNGRADWFVRKYIARLNTDGTLDEAFNLDLSELPGNRVDSIRIQPNGQMLVGGAFTSVQPAGTTTRIARRNFVRLNANLTVDTAFDPGTGGSTGAIVNGLAVQPDNKIVAVGNFGDLGGAKSTNIARYLPEGAPDSQFSNAIFADGPLNAVAIRPNAAPVPSQLSGFAWLSANGTLRSAFATARARLSGEIDAIAVDSLGRVLLGGVFTNLDNTTAGNLVRFNAAGQLDTSFNPRPNGRVSGIAVQRDGRIVVVGTFTLIGDTVRNRIARIDDNGSLDVTFDPNANGAIDAVVIESDDRMIVGGAFTSLTPNATTTAVTRNYLARIDFSGNVDANYNPNPNSLVHALALQSDGKLVAGGVFSSVQPNGGATAFTRNNLARFNTDGTLDQNFNPNPNAQVLALAALANGQFLVGGQFTTLQPNQTGTTYSRSGIARINSDGAVDQSYNPNANSAVTTISLQASGAAIIGGSFTTLQPNPAVAAITRNHLARLNPDGSVDIDFNPDINGAINAVLARSDGTVLVGGSFTELQLNGSIVVGGSFQNIGGVSARNLAMLNENGSVNTSFQPRPDGAVNAVLIQPDGRMVVGGAFTNIAGATRARLARFNADGTLDTTFNPPGDSVVLALLLLPDGRILVGGRSAGTVAGGSLVRLNANGSVDATYPAESVGLGVRGLALQPDGHVLAIIEGSGVRHTLVRYLLGITAVDFTFAGLASGSGSFDALAVQASGHILLGGDFAASGVSRLARLNPNGGVDGSFNPAPNGRVTALALQSDGRVVIGGGFTSVAGQQRVGIARVSNVGTATQTLGVAANRSSVTWTRSGTTGEISTALFELSTDRANWTPLGAGTRVAGTANWQLTGLNLPASGLFYIRARGLVPTSGTSSGVYESVREFTYTNPIPQLSAGPVIVASQAAAGQIFDPETGITPRAAVSVVPGEGTVEIFVASLRPETAAARPARLANLSTRGRVSAENPLILGFALAGTESRRVLVRAVGPGLGGFGVSGALPATRLQVYDSAGRVLATNEGWANAAEVAQTGAATGAFPLTAGSADSAAVLTLAPGNYTIQVVDARGVGGIGLAEIYDAGTGSGARLVNVSSRAAAGTGANALISGFVIAGDMTQRVLLRGVGPGLAQFGATSVVADPIVSLYDSAGVELGSNDNWVASVPAVSSAAASAGAFALNPGSKDAAVLATLPSGAYTIQVRPTSGNSGNALLEIYEVRP